MRFPKDIFDGSIETNLPAVPFMKVYNDLTSGEVVNLRGVDAKEWTLSYGGASYEIKTNDEGVITSLMKRDD